MKAYVIQPYYSFKEEELDLCMNDMLAYLDSIPEDADLIVLPEYSDIPAYCQNKESFHSSVKKYNELIKRKAQEAAIRCHSIVFVNAADVLESGLRNTTYAIDRNGNFVGKYYKAHPAPSEVKRASEGGNEIDCSYSYEAREPYVIEIEGIRFGFMTCYDFYFYENFAPLALKNVDIIIGCSHQRTDTHEVLSIINRFLCYNTNAYLVRSSVSLGESSNICGCSSIIAPDGKVIVDMKSKIGVASADINPHEKYYKAAGYKGAMKSHYEYIEEGRRPWLYRNGGPSVLPFDKYMPYPRLCAHRGFNTVAPENTMPAFGAAVAMGAEEIEFDLWETTDGKIVTAHDSVLERVSDGKGTIWKHSLAELKNLDFGIKFGESYKNLRIPTFEELLQKFAGRVIMNIHVKIWDEDHEDRKIEEIASLLEKYDCPRHVYFMSINTDALLEMRKRLPTAGYCQGAGISNTAMIEAAIKHGFDKVQLVDWFPYDKSMVDECHANGIKVNFCQTNTVEYANEILDLGVDCLLTNEFHLIRDGVKERLAK